ncbi:hypothetical protein ACS0TY_024287 [Phlomoides rotata]
MLVLERKDEEVKFKIVEILAMAILEENCAGDPDGFVLVRMIKDTISKILRDVGSPALLSVMLGASYDLERKLQRNSYIC